MKVEYINPFIEASTSVIYEVTGFSPILGDIYVKNTPYKGENVIVIIGLVGKIFGNAVLTFSKDVACKIASAMMNGKPLYELDEISKSAISELCNMIMGNTATLFSNNGIDIDIAPPTILTGNNIELSLHKSVIVCIPLLFEDGSKIEIDISYMEK